MFERDKLKRAAITSNSDAHLTEYKIVPNNVNANIRKAKGISKQMEGILKKIMKRSKFNVGQKFTNTLR